MIILFCAFLFVADVSAAQSPQDDDDFVLVGDDAKEEKKGGDEFDDDPVIVPFADEKDKEEYLSHIEQMKKALGTVYTDMHASDSDPTLRKLNLALDIIILTSVYGKVVLVQPQIGAPIFAANVLFEAVMAFYSPRRIMIQYVFGRYSDAVLEGTYGAFKAVQFCASPLTQLCGLVSMEGVKLALSNVDDHAFYGAEVFKTLLPRLTYIFLTIPATTTGLMQHRWHQTTLRSHAFRERLSLNY